MCCHNMLTAWSSALNKVKLQTKARLPPLNKIMGFLVIICLGSEDGIVRQFSPGASKIDGIGRLNVPEFLHLTVNWKQGH